MNVRKLISALPVLAALACDDGSKTDTDPDATPMEDAGDVTNTSTSPGDVPESTGADESEAPDPGGCTDIGCEGGFFLRIKFDGGDSPDGEYTISLEAEENVYTATCVVDDARGECSDMESNGENTTDFVTYVDLHGSTGERYFETSIFEAVAQGTKGSQRGPADITVTVSRDGTTLGSQDFMPQYVHVSDYWGPGCGYCEHLENDIEMTISP